jgi:hypothetical protein
MRNTISKPAIAALMALSLTASASAFALTVEPASAAGPAFHGGGGHAGGGWRGGCGGWHGGGRGGGWHGGGWAGSAVIGGLAAGALLAAPYAYNYGDGGYGGCTAYQPMYDAYGNYISQQLVRTC